MIKLGNVMTKKKEVTETKLEMSFSREVRWSA